ncbi:protein FAR1-RELATED SEQUENCE 5-like [Asparagus officinalis]|uniref:protein FAR1-RELATED SEQUENCE 5-like n=1 Tax=Asparagus officinalis TaxID=4686 RepID=UPI00098E4ECF|nr:protein FAR1-RELATED SEQUENCE 5-like [Asparagus officinalis]
MIIEKFADKKEMSDGFFYDYVVDEGGRLTRIFWADVIGRRNYDVFGDVISFDSTYSTNKYNMKFVPFTGLDNYKKCVVFTAELIAKEDIDNYVWIFEVFMKCMIREPKCIVTDQCPAMKQAIPTVFREARHRLCMWHIMKKFNQKLAKCISKMDDFKRKINALIWSKDIDPATFEVGWKDVMKEFKLESNEWLCELYNIWESWILAYYADDLMAGLLRTTSISESENSFFDKFNRRSDTLTEFYPRYESAMDKQRHTNVRLNYEGTKSMPRMDTPLLLERDAAESISEQDGVKIFSIKDKKRHGKIFEVKHVVLNNDVQCLDGERLDYLEGKLKELKHSLRESSWKSDTQNKNDVMEFFVGSKIPAKVIVKPPIEGRNNGCGRRIVGDYEKSISQRKKKVPRLCNMCKKIDFHDTRTCPLKKTLQQSDV